VNNGEFSGWEPIGRMDPLRPSRAAMIVRFMDRHAVGTGPGPVSDDGCPVEIYRRLRPCGEPDLVRSVLPVGSTVLDLGAGAGRIAHPLIAAGYSVTAVDSSLAMLSVIRDAEVVHSRIEELDLGAREFDGILLASYLLNSPGRAARSAMLQTCRRYVRQSGAFLAQVRSPTLLSDCTGLTREEDGVWDTIETYHRDGMLVTITLAMGLAGRRWNQRFTHEYLDESRLVEELAASRFSFAGWLGDGGEWFWATPH